MPNRVELGGVDELLDELERLAPGLTAEAAPLQATAADRAADALRAAYHRGTTGLLADSVAVVTEAGRTPHRLFTRVVNRAPYAGYYEFGTRRSRAFPTFVPITRRARRELVQRIADLVRQHGLDVRGDEEGTG
jgi:Bacteriophage HK97-gp10, putative tail-component